MCSRSTSIRRAETNSPATPPPARNCCATAPPARSGTPTTWTKAGSTDVVMLIPRMKGWVATYYPGTKIGITEYNWGAEEPHQRRHRAGGHLRHLRPRRIGPGDALDHARLQHAHLQGDEDVSQLRRQQIHLRRHERLRRLRDKCGLRFRLRRVAVRYWDGPKRGSSTSN